ncbi:hypothetical protein RHGRI_017217 [Rhododendron griersonianum]|uniref:Uncharacterized protein n=1 Tax=Rhododendron griersonianum TaxID=479676 RepID=A0AAV6JX17_9ERIC|nr:hypothetical protein RHGRI_017217 [Rhododendron griersonianum]
MSSPETGHRLSQWKTPRNPPLNSLPNFPTAARLTLLERNKVAGIALLLLDQPEPPFGRDVALAAVPLRSSKFKIPCRCWKKRV